MNSTIICPSISDFSFYEIKTEAQAVVFSVFWFVCLTLEMFFSVQTYRFFSSGIALSKSWILRVIYVELHASIILELFYLPGGLICYNMYLYNTIGPLFVFFRNQAFFLLLYYMLWANRSLPHNKAVHTSLEISIIVAKILYLISFTICMCFMHILEKLFYYSYNSAAVVGLLAIYVVIVSIKQYYAIKQVMPKEAEKIRYQWIIITLLLSFIYAFWVINALFIYTKVATFKNKSINAALYFVTAHTIIDVLPCILLILFTKLQHSSSVGSKGEPLITIDS